MTRPTENFKILIYCTSAPTFELISINIQNLTVLANSCFKSNMFSRSFGGRLSTWVPGFPWGPVRTFHGVCKCFGEF